MDILKPEKREYAFIRQFVSAYENGSWADAEHTQPDQIDRSRQAVEWFAKRRSDGKTLAIEHTIIEPFAGEKSDFATFSAAFLEIEQDAGLRVPGRGIVVFVPVGVLDKKEKEERYAVVRSVHSWIKSHRLTFSEGTAQHSCSVTGIPGKAPFDITCSVKVIRLEHGDYAESGILNIRRQQIAATLDKVIDKALRKKVPKLVNTGADKRILLLERQHMILTPKQIHAEIDKRRPDFTALAFVDEIWFLETPFYCTAFGGTLLHFELYDHGGELLQSLDFHEGKLLMAESVDD